MTLVSSTAILFVLQVTSKLLSFAISQILIRSTSPALYGLNQSLFLCQALIETFTESYRRALLRINLSKFPEKKRYLVYYAFQSLILALSLLVFVAMYFYISDSYSPFISMSKTQLSSTYGVVDISSNQFIILRRWSLIFYAIGLGIKSLIIPFNLILGNVHLIWIPTLIEMLSNLVNSLSLYFMSSSQCGHFTCVQVYGPALFGLAMIIQGVFMVGATFASIVLLKHFSTKFSQIFSSYSFLFPFKDSSAQSNKNLASIINTFHFQSFSKFFQGNATSLVTNIWKNDDLMGVYSVVSNYGSLIARLCFRPIELSSYAKFGQLPGHISKGFPLLYTILIGLCHFGIIISLFGAGFAHPLLNIILGSIWTGPGSVTVLSFQIYCFYVALLGINGILEAFVDSRYSKQELSKSNQTMLVWSIFQTFLTGFLWKKYTVLGMITSLIVDKFFRIFYCLGFLQNKGFSISKFFPPLWQVIFYTCLSKYLYHPNIWVFPSLVEIIPGFSTKFLGSIETPFFHTNFGVWTVIVFSQGSFPGSSSGIIQHFIPLLYGVYLGILVLCVIGPWVYFSQTPSLRLAKI